MATYKLIKNNDGVALFKNDVEIGLYTDVYNFNIETHGWGGPGTDWRQLSFALTYDILKDRDESLIKAPAIDYVFSHAVPNTLEFDSSVIENLVDPETPTPKPPQYPPTI